MPESRNKGGRIPRVSDEDLLDVFRATSDPVLSTSEVADAVPIGRRGVLSRLRDLEENGLLESKQIGGRNTVWWLPDEQAVETDTHAPRADATEDPVDAPDATDADESDAERAREIDERRSQDTVDRTDSSPGRAGETADTAGQDAEAVLRDLDLPGSGAKLDARLDAVLGLYEHLQENAGEAIKAGDLLEHVDAEAVGYASRDSFWKNCVVANSSHSRDTNTLVALPGVEEWGDGEYRYTDP